MIWRLLCSVGLGASQLLCAVAAFTPANKNELQLAVQQWVRHQTSTLAKYGHISLWNVSSVTDMSRLFSSMSTFNSEIGTWDPSSATSMRYMFKGAKAFNRHIEGWNTSQ
eukprot:3534589-Amphidinium_carterae.1